MLSGFLGLSPVLFRAQAFSFQAYSFMVVVMGRALYHQLQLTQTAERAQIKTLRLLRFEEVLHERIILVVCD